MVWQMIRLITRCDNLLTGCFAKGKTYLKEGSTCLMKAGLSKAGLMREGLECPSGRKAGGAWMLVKAGQVSKKTQIFGSLQGKKESPKA